MAAYVYYPVSRTIVKLSGTIVTDWPDAPSFVPCVYLDRPQFALGQWMDRGAAFLFDPRCCVIGDEGELLYDPREHVGEMSREMKRWMRQHADWPPDFPRKES